MLDLEPKEGDVCYFYLFLGLGAGEGDTGLHTFWAAAEWLCFPTWSKPKIPNPSKPQTLNRVVRLYSHSHCRAFVLPCFHGKDYLA